MGRWGTTVLPCARGNVMSSHALHAALRAGTTAFGPCHESCTGVITCTTNVLVRYAHTQLPATGDPLRDTIGACNGTAPLRQVLFDESDEGMLLATAHRQLNLLKIVVTGDGRGGKTSLLQRLRDEPFNADEPSTCGVELCTVEVGADK